MLSRQSVTLLTIRGNYQYRGRLIQVLEYFVGLSVTALAMGE
jgi:hypothetical protein